MFYDKKIKYLNYIVGGERLKGCGFIKVEIRDRSLNLEMVVSGLPPTLSAYTDVWLCTDDATYSLGHICLENGGGSFQLSDCNVAEISPTGVAYDDWKGISVFPGEECEISAYWGEAQKCVLERVEVSKELTGEIKPELQAVEFPIVDGEDAVRAQATVQTDVTVQEMMAGAGEHAGKKCTAERKDVGQKSSRMTEHEQNVKTVQESRQQAMRMAEDKWEQISGIYPHIRPFRDKREFLSIRPADFVLLSAESYKEVNNSFLLHGYYNYQHLILARSLKKGEISYYVGAPGNFFEREKQVAIMFGFTGFECAKDPAREGDFGYYLMEVRL